MASIVLEKNIVRGFKDFLLGRTSMKDKGRILQTLRPELAIKQRSTLDVTISSTSSSDAGDAESPGLGQERHRAQAMLTLGQLSNHLPYNDREHIQPACPG